ncbi:hypothetical protein MULP_00672 [Mycobacterium liflandii 128FXT]|uniref:Peptidase M50 n=1 Tax=Mycobacterium liflandii (strain 128FXT) TaxID=459424 RepID=L7V2L1_MYCL1|nr:MULTISPECIES: hypothetical protein [Mycobacterium ulcerans group]AGC60748.1 hypothetical protein MULP_00672 [Mycobacterium liflandii 128FXT]RFZ58480.1 hypothetical protein BB170200_03126 [Mycobacterium marinum]ULL09300.1 peptidase M50 [Mycobacterium liflandii]
MGSNMGVKSAANTPSMAVLVFDGQAVPAALTGLPTHQVGDSASIDAALAAYPRLAVIGGDADLAAMLTRLLRTDRLDIEVAYVPRRRTTATRVYRLAAGRRGAWRARRGSAGRVPLIRDETATVIVGRARWLPADDEQTIHGEAVVDDNTLFDGDIAGVYIQPTLELPGLRAALHERRPWRRWIGGRAAQLGTSGARVIRDGIPAPRAVRRSTFYRNVEGWLLVR